MTPLGNITGGLHLTAPGCAAADLNGHKKGNNTDIREEVPIKSFAVAVYLCKVQDGVGKFLIIKRSSESAPDYLSSTWQMASGRIEKGEKAWEAALREIKEETGLVPDRFYSADAVELFYEVNQNCININPVFVAILDHPQEVKLSSEHSEFRWITLAEADQYLLFDLQKEMVKKIQEKYLSGSPPEFLRIDIR